MNDCAMCELQQMLRTRSVEIRHELQKMNPITDPNYDTLFHVLIGVDQDYRKSKERADAT